jgi:hypothetical protein
MPTIQKKIILKDVLSYIEDKQITRTTLKTRLPHDKEEVLSAIDYGIDGGFLKPLAGGYVKATTKVFSISEVDYYACIIKLIADYYRAMINGNGSFIVSDTSRKDPKILGRWTRPDITVVSNRTFPYIKQSEFDVITFEVKRPEDCGVLAVFEALAHNSAATKSYTFFPMTPDEFDRHPQGERIREECSHHGVGLFLVEDSIKMDKAVLVIDCRRRPLNPEKCSNFITSVLEKSDLAVVSAWH